MNTLIGEEFRQLSGGEKQLLGLARALLKNPTILIIDEGLNALDIESENMIFTTLQNYAKQGAVLIITHNIKIILKTDYLYVLSKGQIIQEGLPIEMIDDPAYFGTKVKREWFTSFPQNLNHTDLKNIVKAGERFKI
jgi:ABC-type multidrug transport system fused ATPase/permease subunit